MKTTEQEQICASGDLNLCLAMTRRIKPSPFEWTTVNLEDFERALARYPALNTSPKKLVLDRIAASIRNLESPNLLP